MNFEKPLLSAWDKKDWLKLLIMLLMLAAYIGYKEYKAKDETGYADNKSNSEKVESLLRENADLRVQMNFAIDSTRNSERAKAEVIAQDFSTFKNEQMAKLEERLSRAEEGDKKVNRLVKTFNKESQESIKTSRELDSASKKLL